MPKLKAEGASETLKANNNIDKLIFQNTANFIFLNFRIIAFTSEFLRHQAFIFSPVELFFRGSSQPLIPFDGFLISSLVSH